MVELFNPMKRQKLSESSGPSPPCRASGLIKVDKVLGLAAGFTELGRPMWAI